MGDVNGDGLLDVAIANAYGHDALTSCFLEPFAANQPNQLFLNRGDNTFLDVSSTSGTQDVLGFGPGLDGSPTITWAVGMVDIDQDGDTDVVFGDDQCAFPETEFGGVDRGFLHVFINDGTGHFVDQPFQPAEQPSNSWMGLSFGDFDADGHLDIFGSNFGDYGDKSQNPAGPYRAHTSRWLLGDGDGTFSDPAFGEVASVFGWGTGTFDYDNDGDTDIVYHGSLDGNLLAIVDNPGVVLQNQNGTARFELDGSALTTDHLRRGVQALALGDLNRDGFVDIVTASSFDVPDSTPLLPSPSEYGDSLLFADFFDVVASFAEIFSPTPDGFVWNGLDLLDGSLTAEINSGDNGHHWVEVETVGSVGLTDGGRVNRSGFGAVVSFTPEDGKTAMVPITGGSSYASQHSPAAHFGLGNSTRGTVEILWPGVVRNRLYDVLAGERITLPEIPCSFDGAWRHQGEYVTCVNGALSDLEVAGARRARFLTSAIRAFRETR